MLATDRYIDVKDAKKAVVRILKTYGSLNYSRLLMATELPEDILKKALDILKNDEVVALENDDDPRYALTSKGLVGSFWPFS